MLNLGKRKAEQSDVKVSVIFATRYTCFLLVLIINYCNVASPQQSATLENTRVSGAAGIYYS